MGNLDLNSFQTAMNTPGGKALQKAILLAIDIMTQAQPTLEAKPN